MVAARPVCCSRIALAMVLMGILAGCAIVSPKADTPSGNIASGERPELGRFFAGVEGGFVLLDGQTGQMTRYNPQRVRTRYLPASTFKIPHSLIALDSAVAGGPDFALAWDAVSAPRQAWWPASWARDHTLRTALPNSVVWYYQLLARRIGPQRMQTYLERFDYGNRNIAGGIDRFWLTGGLRISPEEQVEFLRRFYFGELGVSARSTEIVKSLLILEKTASYRLSGKTGWAGFGDLTAPQTGWLIGYLERDRRVYFFATHIDILRDNDAKARLAITKSVLRDLELID